MSLARPSIKESIKEWSVFFLIFTGLLFPLRFVFNNYLHHYWFGSLGILSIVTFTLFYLSNKNKLGYVGYVIKKRLVKRSKGKAFKAFLISSSLMIYMTGLIVTGIIVADKQVTTSYVNQLAEQHVTTINQVTQIGQTDIQNNPPMILPSLLIVLTPNPLMFQVADIMNQLSHGYAFAICSILFVEQLEFLGIILFFRYRFKESA